MGNLKHASKNPLVRLISVIGKGNELRISQEYAANPRDSSLESKSVFKKKTNANAIIDY